MALEFITIGEVPKFVKTVLLRPEDERNLQSFTSAIPPTDFEEEKRCWPRNPPSDELHVMCII